MQGAPDQARRVVAVTNGDSQDESVRLVARRLSGRGSVTTIARSATADLRDDDLVVMAIEVTDQLPGNLRASSVTIVN